MPVTTCPWCNTRVQPASGEGKPAHCPKCRRSFTEERWDEPSDDDTPPKPARKPRPKEVDDGIPIRSKRTTQRPKLLFPITVGAAFLVGLCSGIGGTVIALNGGKGGAGMPPLVGPAADREGEEWTYRELRDYLERNGQNYRMVKSEGGICFVDANADHADHVIQFNAENGQWRDMPGFFVQQLNDARTARDGAGRRVDGTHAWGRFYFRGDEAYIARIRKLLR